MDKALKKTKQSIDKKMNKLIKMDKKLDKACDKRKKMDK